MQSQCLSLIVWYIVYTCFPVGVLLTKEDKSLNLYCVKYFGSVPITIKFYKIHTFQFNYSMTEYTLLCTLRDQDTNVYIPFHSKQLVHFIVTLHSLDTDDDDGKMQCQDKEMGKTYRVCVLRNMMCFTIYHYVSLIYCCFPEQRCKYMFGSVYSFVPRGI